MINNALKISGGGGNSLHIGDIIESYQNLEQKYPNEWMLADGRILNVANYKELYKVLNNALYRLPKAWAKSRNIIKGFDTVPSKSVYKYNKNNGTIINYSVTNSSSGRGEIYISNDFGHTWRKVWVHLGSYSFWMGSCDVGQNKILITTTNADSSVSTEYARASLFNLDVTDDVYMTGNYFDNNSGSWIFNINGYFIMYRKYYKTSGYTNRLHYSLDSSIPTSTFISGNINYCKYSVCDDMFLIRYNLPEESEITYVLVGTKPTAGNYESYTVNFSEYTDEEQTAMSQIFNPSSDALFVFKDGIYILIGANYEIRTADFANFEIIKKVNYPYTNNPVNSAWKYPSKISTSAVNNTVLLIKDNYVYFNSTGRNLCCYDLLLHTTSNFTIAGSDFSFIQENRMNSINSSTTSFGGRGLFEINLLKNDEFMLPNYNFEWTDETNFATDVKYYPMLKPPTYIKVK